MNKLAESQLGIHILGPTYFGVRQVGLKPDKKINTPADMAGIKLRMPGGDAWQFLGTALGANPTPMAYAEVYTGLQTGAIDGQDNPLPNVENMKFYEVMSQIVLTSHLVGFDLLTVSGKVWTAMTPEQQAAFQAAADKAIDWSTEQHLKREAELVEVFKGKGLNIYTPDVEAFRKHVQKKYLESDLAKSWPRRHGRQDQRALGLPLPAQRGRSPRRRPATFGGADAAACSARSGRGCGGAPRTSPSSCSRPCSSPSSSRSSSATSSTFRSAGPPSSASSPGSGSSCGARPSWSARTTRSASTSSTAASGRGAPRHDRSSTAAALVVLFAGLAAGGRRLRRPS